MKFFSWFRTSRFDAAVACLSGGAYGVALFSTAIGGFWTGPDFDHPPMSGLNCLLSGWLHFPMGWLANPCMFASIGLLLTRYRVAAFLSAIVAITLAWSWANEFCRQFSPKLLLAGYDWWLLSMQVLVVGGFCTMVLHCSETWQSLRSLWRTCRGPFIYVREGR